MASKKSKSSTPAAASPAIRDLLKGAETPSQQLARLVTQSSGAASTVKRYTETDHTLDSLDLLVELRQAGDEAVAGKLDRYERMLASQALTLDCMFQNLAERAGRQQTLPGLETLLRMALKAQSQSRATVEALAAIKNPMPYIRQANIAQGHQQVNNGRGRARAEKSESAPNKLLEVHDGQRLEPGAQAAAGRADPALAAVGEIDRAQD
ncbi:MAG: hypothetical protein H6927_12045 [Burkholderiaceae bacterium]|nr:hypothetical protein [Burkholderiaceae bacterium]MCP5218827.1 hypothetical protein [Burkholderiaceae bacterium]